MNTLIEKTIKYIEELEHKNKRLVNTLKYYADERNYDPQYKLDIMRDCGELARKELNKIEEPNSTKNS